MVLGERVATQFRLPLDPSRSPDQHAKALVVTDNETTHKDNGISWYEGQERTRDFGVVYEDLWLPRESLAVIDAVNAHGGVTLIGEAGSGKSSVLFGVRAVLRSQGVPYVNINAHYTNTKADIILGAIDSAEENGMAIVYDSADYLAGANKKVRSRPIAEHLERNQAIMKRLMDFRENGGHLVLSSHHPDWFKDMAHPALLPTWESLIRTTAPVTIDVHVTTSEERDSLLRKMGARADTVSYIAQLPDNPDFQNHIVHVYGDKRYLDWAVEALTSYPILKLLAKDKYGENQPVIDAIVAMMQGEKMQEETWDTIARFAYSKTHLLTFFTKSK